MDLELQNERREDRRVFKRNTGQYFSKADEKMSHKRNCEFQAE